MTIRKFCEVNLARIDSQHLTRCNGFGFSFMCNGGVYLARENYEAYVPSSLTETSDRTTGTQFNVIRMGTDE